GPTGPSPGGSTRRSCRCWPGDASRSEPRCARRSRGGKTARRSSSSASAVSRRRMPVDVLAVSAHADDVELTCAGTLLRLRMLGYRVGIVDLTRGEMGTRGTPEGRAREAARAAEILGAEFRLTLDFGDGGLRRTREEELALIDVIRREKPRLILTPYPGDRHP